MLVAYGCVDWLPNSLVPMDPFEVGASPKQCLVVVGAKEPSQRREVEFALALRKARVQLAWCCELDPKADSTRHSKSHLAE